MIDNNDGDEQNFTIPLLGTGTTETHQIDRFEQAAEQMVDVLWVVDDSGSMSEEQNNLASNFGEFIRYATQELNVDFHIAVTTTLADGDMAGLQHVRRSEVLTRHARSPKQVPMQRARVPFAPPSARRQRLTRGMPRGGA